METKVISLQTLREALEAVGYSDDHVAVALTEITDYIDKQPDALVRCGICKHRSNGQYKHLGELMYFCPKIGQHVAYGDYCFMGEEC